MAILKGNYIFTQPGQQAFLAASNYVNYVLLGDPAQRSFYLEARIDKGEFLISGRLYRKDGSLLCEIYDNRVKDASRCKIVPIRPGGYELRTPEGEVHLRLRVKPEQNVCLIQGTLYDDSGSLVAEGNEEDFRIYKGPAILGKFGSSLGIVIGR